MGYSVLNDDEEAFLARVPPDGSPIGNITLRRNLGWSQSRYDEVHGGLVDKGVIGVGKGQGGSVWLVHPHLLTLVVALPSDESFATRGSILKQTGWSEEKFAVVANIAAQRGIARPGPRNNLGLILTPEVEEFLLVHALGGDIMRPFDAAGMAAYLSWTVNRIHEIRARILEKERVAESQERRTSSAPRRPRSSRATRAPQRDNAKEHGDGEAKRARGPVEVFVAYAPADSELREKLQLHVSSLRRTGAIRDWSAAEVLPGQEWERTKREKLNRADVVLLLISSDFIGSYGDEMAIALERHEAGEAVVVPVVVRRCHWEKTELGKLSPLPKGGVPIKSWPDVDEALYSVVQGIEAIVHARAGF